MVCESIGRASIFHNHQQRLAFEKLRYQANRRLLSSILSTIHLHLVDRDSLSRPSLVTYTTGRCNDMSLAAESG